MSTTREVLTEEFGADYERTVSTLTVAERRVTTYVNSDGFNRPVFDYVPCVVLSHTVGRSLYGYEDRLGVANYRVLSDAWSEVDGLSDGPYSDCTVIALDLDSEAPEDLADVVRSLESYPVLSDDEYTSVEMEMITEHWESYGRADTLDTVAKALGADNRSDLTDNAEKIVETLVTNGIVRDLYPEFIDESMVEFHADEIARWITATGLRQVTVNRYGRKFAFDLRRGKLVAG